MSIINIEMISFRNHNKTKLNFVEGLNIIWGENGSGKTSVLEAIHSLSYGKSFRTNKTKELIKSEEKEFIISGNFINKNKTNRISMSYDSKKQKKIKLNKNKIKTTKEMFGKNNMVVLSPEEQEITKGSFLKKRQFLNKMFSSFSNEYFNLLLKYNRQLKQRNEALKIEKKKKSENYETVSTWDKPLSLTAEKLWGLRCLYVDNFKQVLNKTCLKYDKDINIDIINNSKVKNTDEFILNLRKNFKNELFNGFTQIGPHKDEFDFLFNEKNIKYYGSEGEHKISLILLKLSELQLIEKETKQKVILLIDDLFATLDRGRSKKTMFLLQSLNKLKKEKTQTIVTTTDLLNLSDSGLNLKNTNTKTYHLERGCRV